MMRRFILPMAVAAVMASAQLAHADQTTGVVMDVDYTTLTLTLEDGMIFQLPADWADVAIEPGTPVAVTFETLDGMNVASAVIATD